MPLTGLQAWREAGQYRGETEGTGGLRTAWRLGGLCPPGFQRQALPSLGTPFLTETGKGVSTDTITLDPPQWSCRVEQEVIPSA